jgi:osmotically-inducible protein OsmY
VAPATPAGLRHALKDLDILEPRIELIGDRLYLRGLAPCYRTKQIAGRRMASAAPGVEVMNELRIAHGASSDDDVLRGIEAAIRRAAPGALRRITAKVDAGDAYLNGTARDEQERSSVEAAIWQVPGVMRVHSRVRTAGDRCSDGDVSMALADYVARSLTLPYDGIRVTYRRGVAALYGEVATLQQREAIEDLIRWHEHVRDVLNHITVAPPPDVA